MIDNPIPSSVPLERYICGALMVEEDADITRRNAVKLMPDDFTDTIVKQIISEIFNCLKLGKTVDLMSITLMLPDISHEVLTIVDCITSTANYDARFFELREITLKRLAYIESINFCGNIIESNNPIEDLSNYKFKLEQILGNRPTIQLSKNMVDVNHRYNFNSISSGYLTHDWNDSGFKGGAITLLTGERNSGKTAFIRQALYACAMQGHTGFMFSGENTSTKEKNALARFSAKRGELEIFENLAGRSIFMPSQVAIDRFDADIGQRIFMADSSILKGDNVFEQLLSHMEMLYNTYKTKLFVIDNMMQINQTQGNDKFSKQTEIVKRLRLFAEERGDTHVVLIVHPRGGDGMQRISGSQEQQNIADTIIRYVRLRDPKDKEKALSQTDFNALEKESVSAIVINEKVRDEGTQDTTFLTWDKYTGTLRELSARKKASEYEAKGFWVKAISRYSDEDIPKRKDING